MTRSEYFERWAELHGGLDPRTSIPVQGWLTVTYVLAKPLVLLRMSPNAVTMLGMLVALSVPYWVVTDRLFVAGVVALVAGLIDNLDGAVAIMTGRSSDFGYVLDSVADRVGDAALLVGLGLAASTPWPAVAAACLAFLQEYTRARAAGVGFTEIGVISLSERPTRVLIVGMFLIAAATAGVIWALIGGWVALIVAVAGFGQVLWAVRSRLASSEG
ncbi:MAG: CDP-alcohol phosphatidyltransferase family protein [Actinobacteria bacterium]|nr:CDP-alcohol phosphatidyltransferase family protein [Micrococcales bacterium]MCB0903081.1 CDP-alcohol phosphatidyltransferase family protein [Actinomycetota bacterium]MCO5298951.1 CDP-alcohol phosphatidyltransferase family protein [Candidatus Nanopelagicales bacterium]MCB9428844.1 CDP-alcohol phosphatidyltransferase family protein [Actinomycetota bacterium]HPE11479.1 CDP-alcohol phosphatidyltransferase family protein [Actinomycetota bacterium]